VNEQPDDEIEEDDIIECKERLRKFVEEKLNEYGEPIKFGRTKIIKEYFSNIKANYLAKLKYDAPLASYIIDLDDKYLVKDNFQIKLEHYKNHILSKFNTTINIKIIKFLEELSSEKTTNEVRKINYIEFYKLVSKLGKLALLDVGISMWKKNDANKDDVTEGSIEHEVDSIMEFLEKISGVPLKWAEFASNSSTHRKKKYGNRPDCAFNIRPIDSLWRIEKNFKVKNNITTMEIQLNFMLDNETHKKIPIGQLVKLDTLLYSHGTPTSSSLLYNLLRKLVDLGCLLKDIKKEYESCINSSLTYNPEDQEKY
ncbi:12309_t:CDS:2, partial [Entrophospora sp. SA101]